jgi:hypothetical protein
VETLETLPGRQQVSNYYIVWPCQPALLHDDEEFNRRQARWAEKLNAFNFIIEHRPGIKILRCAQSSARLRAGNTIPPEYRNIQSYLPYMTNCVWVYSALGSKTKESAPKSTARNTRARRMAKSLKIKRNTVDTLNPMS